MRWLVAVALVAAGGCAQRGATAPAPASAQPGVVASVVRVVDGDTIRARVGPRTDKIRFLGIDTPESVKPNTPVQCFALEASARTKVLLPHGTAIRLVGDVEQRDKYGRLLAYVYRASDGLFVNLALVREGYAASYTFPPNVAHATEFVGAAREARDAGRGLWGRCGDAVPHDNRGGIRS